MPALQSGPVGDERSSPTRSTRSRQAAGSHLPSVPVVLGEQVLDRDDGEFVAPLRDFTDQLAGVAAPAVRCATHTARRQKSSVAATSRAMVIWSPGARPGALDSRHQQLECCAIAAERQRDSPLVGDQHCHRVPARRDRSRPVPVRPRTIRSPPRTSRAPAGMTRKSCTSSRPPAWAPPETMLTIGMGSGSAPDGASRRANDTCAAFAAAISLATDTDSTALAPSRPKPGDGSSAASAVSTRPGSERSSPTTVPEDLGPHVFDRTVDSASAETRSRRRAARAPRASRPRHRTAHARSRRRRLQPHLACDRRATAGIQRHPGIDADDGRVAHGASSMMGPHRSASSASSGGSARGAR